MNDLGTLLLLTSFSESPSFQGQNFHESIERACKSICDGHYAEALSLSVSPLWEVVARDGLEPESAPDWFNALKTGICQLLDATATPYQIEILLLVAISSLYSFMQANLTGPAPSLPECPFDAINSIDKQAQSSKNRQTEGSRPESSLGRESISPGDRWAVAQLCEDGEEIIGRISYPQYLLLAKSVLLAPAAERGTASGDLSPSWPWWALRTVLLQQRLLGGRSATLSKLLQGLTQQVLALFRPLPHAPSLPPFLLPAALLEASLAEMAFGRAEAAGQYLQRSCQEAGFRAELTGTLGVRTAHQQDPKAQLVVRVETGAAAAVEEHSLDSGVLEGEISQSEGGRESELTAELRGLEAQSDVLQHPHLTDHGSTPPFPTDLGSLQQALLLALGTQARKGSASDGLNPWESAAFVDAVEQQDRSQFVLWLAARLARVRHEKERVRTRERALLLLEQLVSAVGRAGKVPVQQRMRFAFSTSFPLTLSLRKELGQLLVAAGLVGGALPIFESLELWDPLAVCYQLLGKKVQAEAVVRRRLEVTPDDPRLWCALGDLTLEDHYYREAWERSGHRSARAQRSLARNAVRAKQWSRVVQHWELALALNPLNPEGWFSLGFAYIKERDYPKALQACSRCVQLDPDNGEAWNNLAAIHLGEGRWGEAFNALGEATKHKRDSWQTWENYADAATKVGQWQVAVRALRQVLGISQGSRAHLGILDVLVAEVERGRRDGGARAGGVDDDTSGGAQGAGEEESAGGSAPDPSGESAAPAAPDQGGGAGMAELAAALASLSSPASPRRQQPGDKEGEGGEGRGGGGRVGASKGEEGEADGVGAGQSHELLVLEKALGVLLKEVAGAVAGDSAFWEVYARFYTATGYPEAARECLLKRVRALQGKGWQQEQAAFEAFAGASLQLCQAYLEEGGPRELSSARMHLRGVVRQAGERYSHLPQYTQLQELLDRVEHALQSGAVAR